MSDVLWAAEASSSSGLPTVHALVIGVSAYDHLTGGSGTPTDEPLLNGLGQLSAAATSATRVALWLRDHFAFPSVMLGSVRLLASPSPGELALPGGVGPPPATYDEVRKAVAAWRRDARSTEGNVTLLYVAGHGIQTSNEGGILLLQDAGSPESLTPLERAIDVASVRRGMVADPTKADTVTPAIQYYFYDACRIVPSSAAGYITVPAGVSLDEPKGSAPTTSYVLWASRSRDYALADGPSKTTLFSKAFTDVLESRAAADPDGRTVRLAYFGIALEEVVGELAANFGEEQTMVPGGSGSFTTPVYLRPEPAGGGGGGGGVREIVAFSEWRPVYVTTSDGDRKALTINDARGAVVADGATGELVDLPPGEYVATVTLPWGGSATAPFSVTGAEGQVNVTVVVPVQPGGSTLDAPRLDRQLGPRGSPNASWCMRFLSWTPSGLVHRPDVTPPLLEVDHLTDDGVVIIVHAQGPVLPYAQLRTDDGRSLIVALPILRAESVRANCWLHVRVSDTTLGAAVRFFDAEQDSVAGYLSGGRPDYAAATARSAETLLFSKVQDPIGAALGGYALLRLNDLDRLHDWPANLANGFPWLPDGPVIAGELAVRQGDDRAAAAWFALAVARGIPLFSEGLSLLANRIPRLLGDPDVDSATRAQLGERAGALLALTPTAEFGALATTMRADADPGPVTAQYGWRRFVRVSEPRDPRDFWRAPVSDDRTEPSGQPAADAVFRLHVLPAGIGDALVLEYGSVGDIHRVVIDGGVPKTSGGLVEFLGDDADVELMIVTHIDNDHIAGMLKVLEATTGQITFGDVWFNGFRHLPESPLEAMGPVEGERLSTYLVENDIAWNTAFGGNAVMVPPGGMPPSVTLPGGLKLTVLSPGHDELFDLRKKWLPVVQEAGLDPAVPLVEEAVIPAGRLERMGGVDVAALAAKSTQLDHAAANGSSIAVLAEWAGHSCLLTGDAHADVLLAGIDALLTPGAELDVDVFKLAHHGSKANVTDVLMQRVTARQYVFSSSGEGKSQHPNDEAVARTIVHSSDGAVLAFNYRTMRTEPWDDAALKAAHRYATLYPNAEHGGLTIDLMAL